MFSCTRNTALSARVQFGPRAAAKRSSVVVVARSSAKSSDDAKAMSSTTVTKTSVDNNDSSALLCSSRRRALLSAAAAAPLFSFFSSLSIAPPASAAAAAAKKKLPKLDALKLYGSAEAAEAARAAAVAGARAALASVDPSSGGVLLRLAFHDAGTWDGAKRTGGANGSILNELERPENGGLKYGAALLANARRASLAELPSKNAKQLTDADFIQVVGAAAVELAGGPSIAVPLGRPDSKAKAGDPAGQLPSKDLSARGLIDLFSSNGYSTRDMVALSGAHTLGLSRTNDPKGPMTKTPGQFSNDYFQLLLKGGGAFPSDRALVTDPATKKIVTEYAKDKKKFFDDFAAAYVRMGLKGLQEGEEA